MNPTLIYKTLQEKYPNPKTALEYNTPFQLLIATVLSAQSKDSKVNEITSILFTKYPDSKSLGSLSIDEIENKIKSIGLYKNKAKYIKGICDAFNNVPPKFTVSSLSNLPGVGRKTANVVINETHPSNINGIAVDTHVKRVSKRIGLTKEGNPIKVEQDLMRLFDKTQWRNISHYLIFIGREYCGRKPNCRMCPINAHCNYFKESRK